MADTGTDERRLPWRVIVLRIGLLGASGIAPRAVIEPAKRRADATIAAIAARDADRAVAYAGEHGIKRSYGSYTELLGDPEIDVVYNALPNSEHAEWTIAALEAGKDVLCEKPSGMNAAEAQAMVDTADRTGRRLVEAFHDRYHPLTAHLLDLLSNGELGAVRNVTATMTTTSAFSSTAIRHVPELGGGALLDLGSYLVHWVRTFGAGEPTVVAAEGTRNPLGADLSIQASLLYATGAVGTLTTSMDNEPFVSMIRVETENGSLDATGMLFPHQGHSVKTTIDGLTRITTVSGRTSYDHQLEALIGALETGERLPTEGADIVANMALIDAIYAAAGFDRSFAA